MTIVLVSYGEMEAIARHFLPRAAATTHGPYGRTYRIYKNAPLLPDYCDLSGAPILTTHPFDTFEQAKRWVEQQQKPEVEL